MAVGIDRQIHGVSIAPGIKTALRALRSSTAQLPEVPLRMPESTLGRNTEEAIQSGVLVGYTGLVEKLINEYRAKWSPDAYVIATGGLNKVLTPLRSLFHEVYANLTLDGLHAIGQKLNAIRSH
jgi:type III pantothenate kinase